MPEETKPAPVYKKASLKGGLPYVWVSWITDLLASEADCEWAVWFKARHWYTKIEDDAFDSHTWKLEHQALVDGRAIQLEADGWKVYREGENDFAVKGQTAILSGKPDIVAFKDDRVLVSDGKGGKPYGKHIWQVLIYLLYYPLQRKDLCEGKKIEGELVYPDRILPVPIDRLTVEAKARIKQLMMILGFTIPPEQRPSDKDCRFCNIHETYCAKRITKKLPPVETTDF